MNVKKIIFYTPICESDIWEFPDYITNEELQECANNWVKNNITIRFWVKVSEQGEQQT